MRNNPEKFAELDELLGALRDNTITDEQMVVLDHLLATNAEAREYYLEYMDLCATLGHFQGELTGRSRPDGSTVPLTPQYSGARRRRLPGLLTWLSVKTRKWLLAAAAAVLVGFSLSTFYLVRQAEPIIQNNEDIEDDVASQGVAVLTRAVGVEWEGETPAIGSKLRTRERLRLRSGIIQLEFFSGALLVIEGPADFELKGAEHIYWREGRMRAWVSPPAKQLVIDSPAVELIDRGTEFGFHINHAGEAEVHVFAGKVELHPFTNKPLGVSSQFLTTGNGVSISPNGALRKIAVAPNSFVNSARLEQKWRDELQRRHEKWQTYSQQLRADSRLILYYTFQDQQPWERILLNRAITHEGDLNGVIIGCAWSEGRWLGKKALDFKRPSDRVRLHVPGTYRSLTFLAWVRVDAFDQYFSALMLTDGWDLGAPHWQLTNQGTLLLGVRSQVAMGYNYPSQVFLEPDKLGTWLQLATVYDHRSRTVTHYVNGRSISREPICCDAILQIGDAEIGNWGFPRPQSRPHEVIRNLNGRIDEFALYGEALSAEEIQRLYEIGKPYP
jgi:hypothetical protein